LKNKPCEGLSELRTLEEAELGPEQQAHWALIQKQELQPLHPQGGQALEGTGTEMAEAYAQYGWQQSLTWRQTGGAELGRQ